MLHRLCEPPSIPLSFSLAAVLPRRRTHRFCFGTDSVRESRTTCASFTAWTTRVSNPVCYPRFRHRCSVRSLRISPLHRTFQSPLPVSRMGVCQAVPRLSRGISQSTYHPAYTLFKPSDSEQRSHLPYYRGCWHGISRCFLWDWSFYS